MLKANKRKRTTRQEQVEFQQPSSVSWTHVFIMKIEVSMHNLIGDCLEEGEIRINILEST